MVDLKPLVKQAINATSKDEREEAIKKLVASLSLDEKIYQLSGNLGPLGLAEMAIRYNRRPFYAGGVRRLNIPAIKFTDGPRGVALNRSTCFPVSMARGATWDPELEEQVGSVMGIEARAQGANFSGAVCINLLRHPSWGRAQETYGEDPYHLAEMGSALARGLQRHIMACAKHYACNSIENSRFYVDVEIDERTLRELYLPHFKKCVDEGIASLMGAYNRVNGEFCCQNRHLLREILKEEWGFEGFVISDFLWAIHDTRSAILAGLDVEMPRTKYYGAKLKNLVKNGEVPIELIDDAVMRIFRQIFRFARVGEPRFYQKEKVACNEHTQLALEVARKSMVLLKNENSFLPVNRDSISKIAVIGKFADIPNLGDRGSSRVYPPYVITPFEGIRQQAGKSVQVFYDSGKNLDQAKKVAKKADLAVVVVGFSWREEGEYIPFLKSGGDRTELNLPKEQEELIRAVLDANQNCVVVIEAGSAVIMGDWQERAKAIIFAWYPGMEGGRALAEIIFGDVNPSGRLPITFPSSYDQLPAFDNRARKVKYDYFHGYRLMDKKGFSPAYPFGFGLSYTNFRYNRVELASEEIAWDESLRFLVELENCGDRDGEEVVQVYISVKNSKLERAPKELKAFKKILLKKAEKKEISFEIPATSLAYFDTESGEWKIEQGDYELMVGSSSRHIHLTKTFKIKS